MLNSSLTFDWLGHVIVKNKWNIPGKEKKWRNQLWQILLAQQNTHLVRNKSFKSLTINLVPRVLSDWPVSRLSSEISLRKSSSDQEPTKRRKQRNQTVYHETYLISIPRPATSVATRMSLAPALRLDKANSLKRKPAKRIFMTGSELRWTSHVTACVRLGWRTNEIECRDAWQKWLQD